ncbi:MAG TPA: deoxyribose-phosphate aldolase [Rikenellaceae bacterium]|nr:deoxyribose-phosphate aldolase [Rikenellaceae bacterium]HBH20673.1 deoxyribose-phosphate aldolase [Rikenellaceae bacterium]
MELLKKYGYVLQDEEIASRLQTVAENLPEQAPADILKKCFSMMDLTTLKPEDTVTSVESLVKKANGVLDEFPGYPLPASICVYPNFASVVRDARVSPDLHVTTVAACFPSSQSFLEVKVQECVLAVRNGADEVDIVLALNHFLASDEKSASEEIKSIRAAIDKEAEAQGRRVVLKVILETGLLVSPARMAEASFLAMEAGADFIKTSTGKVSVNATPTAAYVMCECIRLFALKTGKKVGFKAAGGISTAKDAVCYYYIVSSILGEEWLNKDLFRFGVSRLGNSLVSAIEQKTVNYF